MQNRRLPHHVVKTWKNLKNKNKKETCDTILLHCCITILCISDIINVALDLYEYIYIYIYHLYMQTQNYLKFKNDY